MDMKCELLIYLDTKEILLDMRQECIKFLDTFTEKTVRQFPPFRYCLEIDVMNLLDKNANIGKMLVEEPMKWREMCTDILFACINTLGENYLDITVQRAQINIVPRLKCVPLNLVTPNPRDYHGLVCFQGTLIEISKPSNYIMHSVFSCPEECENNEVILKHIPKVLPKCHVCRSVLFENCNLRRCGEKVQGTFLLKENLLCKRFTITDELIANLILGFRYNLIGIVVRNVFIWSVEPVATLVAPLTMPISADIKKLFNKCNGTPWKFIYCLSSSIGIELCPLNCFMHLKICLLLSLTSVKSHVYTNCRIVHVLAAGLDTGHVCDLMNAAAKLADQTVYLGSTNTSVTTALIASSGGICVLPLPLHAYQQKQLSTLLSAIESKEILVENGRVMLRNAIWAYGMNFKNVNLHNVANIFGSVCRGDYENYNDEITDFKLLQSTQCNNVKEEKQVFEDIKAYLDAIAGIHVELNDAAETLLRNYFVVARKDQPRGISANTMEALVALSQASARLCRRNVANVQDAIFAIWLQISGIPESQIAPEEYIQIPANVKTLDKNINKFKEWLEMFTGNILSTD